MKGKENGKVMTRTGQRNLCARVGMAHLFRATTASNDSPTILKRSCEVTVSQL
jgi:hypothetical protein